MNDKVGHAYQELIAKLDRFIRKFYINQLLRGVLLLVGVGVFLWIIFAAAAYFLYLDTTTRKAIFFGGIAIGILATYIWILRPLFAYMRLGKAIDHDQAAMIIGEHFTEVKDKLLNSLQLRRQLDAQPDHSLLIASIDQKADELRPVPFRHAIDLGQNKRYLPYTIPPLLLLAGLFLWSPEIIRDGSTRILRNNVDFERPAPFHFIVENEQTLTAIQHEDYQVSVKVDGEALPSVAYLEYDGQRYEMLRSDIDRFTYTFRSIPQDVKFSMMSGDVTSKDYSIEVIKRPRFEAMVLKVDYPGYTGMKDEVFTNRGDLSVPAGTRVTWEVDVRDTESLEVAYGTDTLSALEPQREEHYRWTKRAMTSQSYTMSLSNERLYRADSIRYQMQVIPDRRPELHIQQILDSTDQSYAYYTASAEDDYGLTKCEMHYQVTDADGRINDQDHILVKTLSGLVDKVEYLFDADSFHVPTGGSMSYHFRVFDNDGVLGAKYKKSPTYTYRVKTTQEIKADVEERSENIKEDFKKNIDKTKKLRDQLEQLRQRLINKDELNWKDKKSLEDLLKKQQEIKQAMQQMQEQLNKNMEDDPSASEEEKNKMEELDKMMDKVMDDEMQKLMDDIQKLMQEMQREQSLDQMQDMQMQSEKMELDMERMEELFNQLEVEKKIQDQIEELEKLAQDQEKLSEETEKGEKSIDQLKEDQEQLSERFEQVKKELEEARKQNDQLKQKHSIEDTKDLEKLIDRDQKESQNQLDKADTTPEDKNDQDKDGDKKEDGQDKQEESGDKQDDHSQEQEDGQDEQQDSDQQESQPSSPSSEQSQQNAAKSQKQAGKKMQQMAQQLQSGMQGGEMQQMQEDMEMLRQLLENILTLSFDEEDLKEHLAKTNRQTSRYVQLVRDQHKIEDDFAIVKDSLKALSQRNDQIGGFVMDKVFDIERLLETSIAKLEERKPSKAAVDQGFIMTYLNDLALMLNESMQNMQQQMAQQMSGNQMCNNPKPGAGGKPGTVPMDKITEGQQEIQKGLKEMLDKQKGGQKPSSEDFGRLAQQQAALRKMLRDAQQQRGEQGKNSQQLQEIIDAMDGVEKNLVNKQLTTEMLKRQQEIQTRLLQAERAERERELDEKREAQTAEAIQQKLPPAIEAYLKQRKADVKQIDRASPSLMPYYKRLVDLYYKALED